MLTKMDCGDRQPRVDMLLKALREQKAKELAIASEVW